MFPATQVDPCAGADEAPGADTHHLLQLQRHGGQPLPVRAGAHHVWAVPLLLRGKCGRGPAGIMGGQL